MKALLYHGPGVKVWKDVAEPKLQAIVDVGTTAICGTDLHNPNGDLQTLVDGRIIGHEAVGTVSPGRRRRREPKSRGARPGPT